MIALINWLETRTGVKALMHEAFNERVPGGALAICVGQHTSFYVCTADDHGLYALVGV